MTSYTVRWGDISHTIEADEPEEAAIKWAQQFYFGNESQELVVSTETEVFLVAIAKKEMCEICGEDAVELSSCETEEEVWFGDILWVAGTWVCAECAQEYADIVEAIS